MEEGGVKIVGGRKSARLMVWKAVPMRGKKNFEKITRGES